MLSSTPRSCGYHMPLRGKEARAGGGRGPPWVTAGFEAMLLSLSLRRAREACWGFVNWSIVYPGAALGSPPPFCPPLSAGGGGSGASLTALLPPWQWRADASLPALPCPGPAGAPGPCAALQVPGAVRDGCHQHVIFVKECVQLRKAAGLAGKPITTNTSGVDSAAPTQPC